MAVPMDCKDSKGKRCAPVLVDQYGRTRKNPDCTCKPTIINPLRDAVDAATNLLLLVGAIWLLTHRQSK